jgi:hypothetical protein
VPALSKVAEEATHHLTTGLRFWESFNHAVQTGASVSAHVQPVEPYGKTCSLKQSIGSPTGILIGRGQESLKAGEICPLVQEIVAYLQELLEGRLLILLGTSVASRREFGG